MHRVKTLNVGWQNTYDLDTFGKHTTDVLSHLPTGDNMHQSRVRPPLQSLITADALRFQNSSLKTYHERHFSDFEKGTDIENRRQTRTKVAVAHPHHAEHKAARSQLNRLALLHESF